MSKSSSGHPVTSLHEKHVIPAHLWSITINSQKLAVNQQRTGTCKDQATSAEKTSNYTGFIAVTKVHGS